MTELSEAYVLGLLADVEETAPALENQLASAKKKAGVVDAELSNLLRRFDESKAALKNAENQSARSGREINDGNMTVAQLHQDIAGLKKKADDIKVEMNRVSDEPALRRKLRRERAKITVLVEEREEEIATLRARVEEMRTALADADATRLAERDRSRALTMELDKLQSQLPSPYLYSKLFQAVAARAHCRLFLDDDYNLWRTDLLSAIEWTSELHRELRAGKYRLDRNSELVGGRSISTAESMFGAVAVGERDRAIELFELATDPGLYFHQIFNVFRVWALGLYLTKRHQELRELLRLHQFAEGLRGGYVNAFIGLLTKDERRVAVGIKDVTKHEWELWQDPSLVRGVGVVNLGAVALGNLALDRGISVAMPGPTVPTTVLAGPKRSKRVASR